MRCHCTGAVMVSQKMEQDLRDIHALELVKTEAIFDTAVAEDRG
jgi:hypothetical protein